MLRMQTYNNYIKKRIKTIIQYFIILVYNLIIETKLITTINYLLWVLYDRERHF